MDATCNCPIWICVWFIILASEKTPLARMSCFGSVLGSDEQAVTNFLWCYPRKNEFGKMYLMHAAPVAKTKELLYMHFGRLPTLVKIPPNMRVDWGKYGGENIIGCLLRTDGDIRKVYI